MNKFKTIILIAITAILPIPLNIVRTHVANYSSHNLSPEIIFYALLCFFLIGILVGLDQLLKYVKSKGHWKVSLVRIISAILLSGLATIPHIPLEILPGYIHFFYRDPFYVWTIVGGYLLITSFYKENKEEVEHMEETNIE